jgi:hypothetical protein
MHAIFAIAGHQSLPRPASPVSLFEGLKTQHFHTARRRAMALVLRIEAMTTSLLIDSELLEAGDAIDDSFRAMAVNGMSGDAAITLCARSINWRL